MRILAIVLTLLLGWVAAQPVTCDDGELVAIPDEGLHDAVQAALRSIQARDPSPPPELPGDDQLFRCQDLLRLTTLVASAPRHIVRSLEGLEYATNLAELRLDAIPVPIPGMFRLHEFHDLEPLKHLPSLQFLYIDGNGIIDLEPLSGPPNLERLTSIGYEILDLEALVHLDDLEAVALLYAEIRDLGPLTAWVHPPARLNLNNNHISDLGPLAANPAFDAGHEIDVSYNCLAIPGANYRTRIPTVRSPLATLQGRGVRVVLDNQSRACSARIENVEEAD